MLRFRKFFWIILVLSSLVGAADEDLFNVDFFCGWGGYYRPMEWTPMEIAIDSDMTEPFAGSITITSQQDGLNTLNVVNEFVLTPNIQQYLPLVTKLVFAAQQCSVRIRNERGRTQWSHDFKLWDFSPNNRLIRTVMEDDMLIGLVGRPGFGLVLLPQQSMCVTNTGAGTVYVGDKLPQMVPWDWTGFVSLDLFILYNPQWDLFNEHQLNAITQWVSNGGRLLLVLGSRPLPGDNPIARMLPFEVEEAKQVEIPQETLNKLKLSNNSPEMVTCRPLKPKSGAMLYENHTDNTNECLFGTGRYGFGRVGVLAFDPSTMSNAQIANSSQFWVSAIRTVIESDDSTDNLYTSSQSSRNSRSSRTPRSSTNRPFRSIRVVNEAEKDKKQQDRYRTNRYEVGLAYGANNAVMDHLYNIAEMRPLSIWWVILLLGTLAVLLGPVDYKILKRLDRLPLTWLTCTFWIVLFSVGAYYGVRALRGGKLQMRIVSVIDGIENHDLTWSTNYSGLFASRSDDYRIEGLRNNQWFSGIAPTEASIWEHNQNVARRNIYCMQHDGGNLPYSLPVNIWTMQCLLNESTAEKLPFRAEVQNDGDEIVVNITNESDSRILHGYVLLDRNRGVEFGQIQPDSSKQFTDRAHRLMVWDGLDINRYRQFSHRGNYSAHFKNEDAFFAQGCLQRTKAIEDYLAGGAAVVCVVYDQAPPPFEIKDRSCDYNHIQLARLVVFPEVPDENVAP
jgi:hypothetical protein